jgi:hypothetical protein
MQDAGGELLNRLMEFVVRKDPDSVHWLTLNQLPADKALQLQEENGVLRRARQLKSFEAAALQSEPHSFGSGLTNRWKAGSPAKEVTEAELGASRSATQRRSPNGNIIDSFPSVRPTEVDNTQGAVNTVPADDIRGYCYGTRVPPMLDPQGIMVGGYVVAIRPYHAGSVGGWLDLSENPWHSGAVDTDDTGAPTRRAQVKTRNIADHMLGQHVTVRESGKAAYSGYIVRITHDRTREEIQNNTPGKAHYPPAHSTRAQLADNGTGEWQSPAVVFDVPHNNNIGMDGGVGTLDIAIKPGRSEGVVEVDPHTGGRIRSPEAPRAPPYQAELPPMSPQDQHYVPSHVTGARAAHMLSAAGSNLFSGHKIEQLFTGNKAQQHRHHVHGQWK